MSVQILVFVVATLVLSVVAHLTIPRFVPAVVTTAIVASLGMQAFMWAQAGHLDAFFVISFLYLAGFAGIIAAVTGALMQRLRTRTGKHRH
jgi:hypothetical protein